MLEPLLWPYVSNAVLLSNHEIGNDCEEMEGRVPILGKTK
jgi:hypothetical protein